MENDAARLDRDAALKRWGAAVPGAVTWTVMLLCVFGTIFFPAQWLIVVFIFLAYLVFRMALHLTMATIGELRIKRWKTRDWTEGFDDVSPVSGIAPADVRHVVLIPNFREPLDVLQRTLDALAVQYRASDTIIPVLAMEDREQGARIKAERLCAEYQGRFLHIVVSVHPHGLPGEVAGKSSNQAWAGRVAREAVEELGVDVDNATISSCDSDSVFHPHYFACVSKLFVSDEKRHNRFWQAPLFFYGNLRSVPFLLRLDLVFLHTTQVAELALPGFSPLPISTYTASMRLIEASGWWDETIIPEDWHMYLRSYFAVDGNVSTTGVWLPTWSDIVDGANTVEALKARYTQLVRHDWGAEDVGYSISKLPGTKAPLLKTWLLICHVLHDHVIRAVCWAVLISGTVITWEIAGTHNPVLLWSVWYLSPWIQALYIINTLFFLSQLGVEMVRRSAAGGSRSMLLTETLGAWVLVPYTGIVSGAFPAVYAQTRLMFGLPISYKVAPKRLAARQPNEI